MCATLTKKNSLAEVLGFTYPKLHIGKSWYIDFCSYDPARGKMRRKKYMLDGIGKVTERRKRAAEMIESLLKLLRSGWSPWVNIDDNRGYILLEDAFKKYMATIEKMPKYKTRKSYTSRLNILREYISGLLLPPKYVYQFDTAFVSDFLDWIYLDREVNARTRNNYRQWCSSLAMFFVERQYLSSNPVEKIKPIDETPKKRQPLSPTMLKQMSEYLSKKNPMFLLACRMEYYTFIRPEELSHIKINDISIADQAVFISAEVSKNKRDGRVGLNDEIIKLMLDLDIFKHDGDCFLFGAKLRTSTTKGSSEMFRREWKKMRRALRWGDEYQFYSLKDSGIRDLANAEGIVVARDQARHTDISTTNKYLQGRAMPVHEATKHFEGHL
ncbi:MAG: site-specific integrase [Muribaculaceae bacterium]|nr:site-specific integrase [Muribaculaceae bacterium]